MDPNQRARAEPLSSCAWPPWLLPPAPMLPQHMTMTTTTTGCTAQASVLSHMLFFPWPRTSFSPDYGVTKGLQSGLPYLAVPDSPLSQTHV